MWADFLNYLIPGDEVEAGSISGMSLRKTHHVSLIYSFGALEIETQREVKLRPIKTGRTGIHILTRTVLKH